MRVKAAIDFLFSFLQRIANIASIPKTDNSYGLQEHRSPREASLAPASPLTGRRSPLQLPPPQKEAAGDSQRAAMWRWDQEGITFFVPCKKSVLVSALYLDFFNF